MLDVIKSVNSDMEPLPQVSNKTATRNITENRSLLALRLNTVSDSATDSATNDIQLVSTRLVSIVEFKKILEDKCEIEYPISIPLRKQLEKRYSSKLLRKYISNFLFGKKNLRDVVWSRLRKIAIAGRTNTTSVDKSKVLSNDEFFYIFLAATYIKERKLKYVPQVSKNVIANFKAWISLILPKISKIEIFYTLGTNSLQIEVDGICDWFIPDSTRESQIEYGKLNDLLKKTFYGYSPTPQYIGKLGFSKPTSRKYSFDDFVLIRNRFIQSRSNQSRPTSFILFEKL
jgi:hypothetical protein